jgi:hypothetical protein
VGVPKCKDPGVLTDTGTGVCRCECGLAQSLDDGGVGHAAALAHRLQPVPTAPLFKRIHKCGHDAGTARAQWMSDRDRPAVDVGLGQIRSGVMGPGQRRIHGATC